MVDLGKMLGGVAHLSVEDVRLTRREAASYLRCGVATLERWASQGKGPPCKRVGGKFLYPLPDLREFAGVKPRAAAA